MYPTSIVTRVPWCRRTVIHPLRTLRLPVCSSVSVHDLLRIRPTPRTWSVTPFTLVMFRVCPSSYARKTDLWQIVFTSSLVEVWSFAENLGLRVTLIKLKEVYILTTNRLCRLTTSCTSFHWQPPGVLVWVQITKGSSWVSVLNRISDWVSIPNNVKFLHLVLVVSLFNLPTSGLLKSSFEGCEEKVTSVCLVRVMEVVTYTVVHGSQMTLYNILISYIIIILWSLRTISELQVPEITPD